VSNGLIDFDINPLGLTGASESRNSAGPVFTYDYEPPQKAGVRSAIPDWPIITFLCPPSRSKPDKIATVEERKRFFFGEGNFFSILFCYFIKLLLHKSVMLEYLFFFFGGSVASLFGVFRLGVLHATWLTISSGIRFFCFCVKFLTSEIVNLFE